MEKRLHRIHISSRDSARTPMQWDDSENAGFTTGKPWFYVNPNYKKINVAAQEEEGEYSILNFYRRCLELRKHSKTLLYGTYREYFPKDPNLYLYERRLEDTAYLVICSFAGFPVRVPMPKPFAGKKGRLVLCNYPKEEKKADNLLEKTQQKVDAAATKHGWFRPYEARIYRFDLTEETGEKTEKN